MRTFSILALAAIVGVANATLIDTYPSWNGSAVVTPFGVPDTQTYGQTFKAPNATDTLLKSFSFSLTTDQTQAFVLNPGPVSFKYYLYEWDTANSRATGSALFTSGGLSIAADTPWTQFTVNPGVTLDAAKTYVGLFSTSAEVQAGQGQSGAAYIRSDVYGDGRFVYLNNGTDTGAWTSQAWDSFGSQDLAFKADFETTVVPEPATLAALGLGLVAILRKRRK